MYLLLRTPARRLYFLLYSLCTLRRPASSRLRRASSRLEGYEKVAEGFCGGRCSRFQIDHCVEHRWQWRIEGRSAAARCVGEQVCLRQRWARGAKVSSRGARKEAAQRMKRYSRRGAAAAVANRTAGSGASGLWRAARVVRPEKKKKWWRKIAVSKSFTDKVCTGSGPVC